MNKLQLIIGLSVITAFTYCKSTKTVSEAKVTTPVLDEKQLAVVQTRWPNTAVEDVKQGQIIFTTKCTECHANQVITELSEKKWLHEIDDMSPKAKLTADEKLKLTKFILSYREANTVSK